jgi:chromosome partitioning protein
VYYKMKTISVLNQKGGVGKTTTTINLAAALAQMKHRVLIIDLDPQANATSGLGVDKASLQASMYEVLAGQVRAEDVILHTRIDGLALLPATTQLAGAEPELAVMQEREYILRHAISGLAYDFILIDCPPSLGLLSINALTAASDVLIPVQTEFYALEGLGLLMQTIQRVQQGLNPDLKLMGVVMTMVDVRNSLSGQVIAEVKKHFGDYVFQSYIPRNIRLAEAPSFGKTVFEHDRWSKGSRAYKQLAKEVAKHV